MADWGVGGEVEPAHRYVLFKPETVSFYLKGKRDADVTNDCKST